jgi:polyhydroxyalkanoate synthesis regulator phasin
MKAVLMEAKTKKLVNKKEGKLHERKARKFTKGMKRKGKQWKRARKKTCKRNISFESSDDEVIEEEPRDDVSSDDVDPLDTNARLVCGESGMDNELWFRRVQCSQWTHSECSGWDTPKNYKCDFCFLKIE